MKWNRNFFPGGLGFTLNDGSSVEVGLLTLNASHIFDPTKKITKIECNIGWSSIGILRINFFHHQEKLVQVGSPNDDRVKELTEKTEIFEIGEDERLIGCKLDNNKLGSYKGLTWIKMRKF